ncbi:MAG: HPr family phosphocarrier protein [Anaerolineaceae bacterium]|nr:HPr family phosphocarrier protein [Anaerolineaceae bacterium]
MLKREVTILNRQGMHARPAMQIVETSSRFNSRIRVCKGDSRVDAKSIMEVMTLEAIQGTVLTFEADGDDASEALDALAKLVTDKFYED